MTTTAQQPAHILVADDDDYIRLMLADMLGACGHRVLAVANGADALACLQDPAGPEMAILDWVMPGSYGIDVCRQMQAAPRKPRPYLIMLTGRSDPEDIITGLDAGADDFLAKPVHLQELRARVDVGLRMLRAERALVERQQRLEQLNRKLRESQQQLVRSEKMAAIGQVAAGVAHEINNPLGFIMSNCGAMAEYVAVFRRAFALHRELLEAVEQGADSAGIAARIRGFEAEEDLDYLLADVEQLVAESREGSCRVKDIVQNLKNFARVDCTVRAADLNEGLESTIKIIWNELKYKCEVQRDYGELPRLPCRAAQLNQVFMNLLINAAQAIPEKGRISVRTARHDGEVRVDISDSGVGIPPEHLDRLFEPFFTTKQAGQGTGLGLAICQKIVHEHHGRIEVVSEPGRGTTFSVYLPVNPEPETDERS